MSKSRPELLAPAGNMERLKWAVAYNADAVYFGVTDFSLRSFAGNFTLEEADLALQHLHQNGCRGYVTLNIYPYESEYPQLLETVKALADMGADAFIVSDIGVIRQISKLGLSTGLHISTQANTLSAQAVMAYADMGAKRVNLARELSLEQIQQIQRVLSDCPVETEVFVHGSVCFSYSGRCAISDYLTGRIANRGECTHPCRWKYSLMEESRPGEYLPVFEDNRGLYLFNSRDLALFKYIPDLIAAGVDSFKIEGRMKNVHYTAAVLSVYRKIMQGVQIPETEVLRLLGRVNNRGFSEGFMKGSVSEKDYETETDNYRSSSVVVAAIGDETFEDYRICRIKNSVRGGEQLEMLSPEGISAYTMPEQITLLDKDPADRANNQDTVLLPKTVPAYSILRRVTQQ